MSLHRLASVTIGVPNVASTRDYYVQFGLSLDDDGWLRTAEGGRQLRIVEAPTRRLIHVHVGADNQDDVARVRHQLAALGNQADGDADHVAAVEPATGVAVTVSVQRRLSQSPTPPPPYNAPGHVARSGARAPGVLRTAPVTPRRLGHAVLGTTDCAATRLFFEKGIGFKLSDEIGRGGEIGAFLRCSTDHHNLLVLAAPVSFLHHTSWQVDDIDEVGRGATAMLEDHPERHVWGLGRHHAGSNFFWYLKDPAGNFSEYYADLDSIEDDDLWTPETLEGARGLFNWGPPPPPSFLAPDDLADLMVRAHGA
jgi:catechol 2,3-dioxygenase-like lactoylglutathione lyase family enzyme